MMFTNSQKANKPKKNKTNVEFDSILKQMLNLVIQIRANKVQSMKFVRQLKEAKKKTSIKTLKLCSYCFKPK